MSARESVPELVIRQAENTVPVRVRLTKTLTSLGAADDADVHLPLLAGEWAVAHRRGDRVVLRLVDGGVEHDLEPGGHVTLGPVSVALAAPAGGDGGLAVAELAARLTAAETPDDALRAIARHVIAGTGADGGAIIVSERGGYRVAVAVDDTGAPLADAEALLSDTVIREVLGGADAVCVPDAREGRYATVESVVALALRSVLCVPMAAGDQVLGAIFLGKRDLTAPFSPATARELEVLASMAVPLVAGLRRPRVETGVDALLVGDAPAMIEVRRLIERVGPADLAVLVTGETGTGKERTARAVHAASRRSARPLFAINCSAIPAALLEAELFGYAKGAFTGAAADRAGRIEAADGSTLFLDEVGDMPLAMQAALLRVLQEREVVRVGETAARAVDFRLVSATNKDLDAEVAAGRFRDDLLFRLREITIALPPLRARGDDVALLAHLFLQQAERELSLPAHSLSTSAETVLRHHGWPGNVRELRAAMRRAAVLAGGTEITAADLALDGRRGGVAADDDGAAPVAAGVALGDLGRPLAEARDDFVSRYVAAVLEREGGDRARAAEALGISVRSLYRYL